MPTAVLSDYSGVQEYLFSLKARGVRFGIDRMRELAGAIGHPERAVPAIHLAGTNGKGSTAAMLESILRQSGRRTGLYTSPHLVRLGERVQVDRQPLREDEILAFTNELRPIAEELSRFSPEDHASFFEFMTAMAFLQFARQRCDVAVIETGMGGRLDATNIVMPEISVITSISLDHCEQLGDTVERIAAEKAAIIKPGRPVVMGRLPTAAETVIRDIAAKQGSMVHSVRDVFGDDSTRYPQTRLECEYQRWNAATAALVCRVLPKSWGLTEEAVDRGLSLVEWPGRWQHVRTRDREIILDSSHNPEGAEVLDVNLSRLAPALARPPTIVVGALGSARAKALLETAAHHAAELHLVVPGQPRAMSWEQLEQLIPAGFRGRVHRATVKELFPEPGECVAGSPGDTVIVTGSVYLIGEVLERLEPQRGTGEGRLQDF